MYTALNYMTISKSSHDGCWIDYIMTGGSIITVGVVKIASRVELLKAMSFAKLGDHAFVFIHSIVIEIAPASDLISKDFAPLQTEFGKSAIAKSLVKIGHRIPLDRIIGVLKKLEVLDLFWPIKVD